MRLHIASTSKRLHHAIAFGRVADEYQKLRQRHPTVWLDSGANHDSKREVEVTLEDIGIDDDAWDRMTDEEKEEVMREVAFDKSDWGFVKVEDE
jgi:hypothetical protein